MEKKLSEVFGEIAAMKDAFSYKRLNEKKEEVKLKINDEMTLLLTYEEIGKVIVSSLYFKKGKNMQKNKMKFCEYITSGVLVDGKVVDRRSIHSIEELNSIIKEYIEPVSARELLKTFAKKYDLKLKKKKYALPNEMYVFSSLVIRVFKNGFGTEYLIANKRTQEDMEEDIIQFSSSKFIQSLEELEELYEK